MNSKPASRTAEYNALFRAIESSRKPGKRLFGDHLAAAFLGRLKYAYLLSRAPLIGRLVPAYIDMKWPRVRTAHLGRTIWIDKHLRAALEGGISQVVILGAGFDSRAYRLPGIQLVRVFELDHSGTQSAKVGRLMSIVNSIPAHISMLEVDFNRQDFARPLLDSGFDRTKPAFFLLEGVVSYLSKEGVDMTLKSIRMLSAPGSRLLFTYVHGGLLDGSINLSEMGRVPATLRKTGENWTFGIYPEELSDYLAKRGFKLLEDLDSTEWTTRYVGTSGPHQNDLGLYRGAVAEPASGESHSNAVNNSDQLEENSK